MKKGLEEYCPKNRADWRKWLEKYHASKEGVWLIIWKKHTLSPNLSWSEAVDEALCYGWIDGIKHPLNDKCYKQYFTPRKPQSTWSKINKEKVEVLIASGAMTNAGLRCIAVAKKNGAWTYLDQVDNLEIPADLAAAFDNSPMARNYFHRQSKSTRKGLLYWILSAKRPQTRANRIQQITENAEQSKLPGPFRNA